MNDPTPPTRPHGRKMALPMILIIVGSMLLAMLIVSAAIRWMPVQASTFADDVDWLYYLIYWVSVFFTLLIAGLLVFFLFYFRQTDKAALAPGKVTHSTALELTWTIVPVFLVLAFFAVGFKGYIDMSVPPTGSYEIGVTAQQWSWSFQYPNGYSDNDLHIPADRDVKLIMQSNDVIHSLFIKQFRAKKDVVPGRITTMWFRSAWDPQRAADPEHAVTLGDDPQPVLVYDLYCTEYCGQSHSQMNRKVYVHRDTAAFEAWLAKASIPWNNSEYATNPAAYGQKIWSGRCSSCHSADGSAGTGPTWKGLFGADRELVDGSIQRADENYIRDSILHPQKHIVAGYAGVNMASFRGQLKDHDIYAIIQYIKSLTAGQQATDNWDPVRSDPAEGAAPDAAPQ